MTDKGENAGKCKLCMLAILTKCCNKKNKMQVNPKVNSSNNRFGSGDDEDGLQKVAVKAKFNVSHQNGRMPQDGSSSYDSESGDSDSEDSDGTDSSDEEEDGAESSDFSQSSKGVTEVKVVPIQ